MSPLDNGPQEVNKWLIAIAVMAGTFMELVDTTVVNVALPHIAGSLSAGVDESTWVLTSYLVSNAIVMPLSAWLSVRFGRKRLLMVCLALFTGASVLCGLSTSLGELIFFRVFQGAAGLFSIRIDPTHLWQAPQILAELYHEVQRQAQMFSFCDNYWSFTLLFLVLLPLVFVMRPGSTPAKK
jgi:MFS family permease